MSRREHFLVRLSPGLLDGIRRWADDDFRSVNGQIEYLLTEALRSSGRLRQESTGAVSPPQSSAAESAATTMPPAAAPGPPAGIPTSVPDSVDAVSASTCSADSTDLPRPPAETLGHRQPQKSPLPETESPSDS